MSVALSNPNNPAFEALRRADLRRNISAVRAVFDQGDHDLETYTYGLKLAATHGDLDLVKQLLPHSNPQANDSEALTMAAGMGHLDVVHALIPHADQADATNALKLAAHTGQTEVVKALLPHSDPKAHSSQALGWAAEQGHMETVKALLPHSDVPASGAYHLAWRNGHFEVANVIGEHQHQIDPDWKAVQPREVASIRPEHADPLDEMAFNRAASFGDIDAVRAYLNEGRVDPTNQNFRALKDAAWKGHDDVVGILLRFSDDPQANQRALEVAAQAGHAQCVEQLLPHCDPKADLTDALYEAIGNGHHECLLPLLNRSENLDHALVYAAGNGKGRCLDILMTVADPTYDDSLALQMAASGGHTSCLAKLIPVCDPQANDNYAIAYASMSGHLECVELLLPHCQVENTGAYRAAVENGHTDVSEAIQEHLATKQKASIQAEMKDVMELVPDAPQKKRRM
ncbi:ankyrin repeat domain-containing protein [Pseudoxanthomonas winnipegensis]|uniref:ankyrin repeat domain-containing protein n=1 Tax=Pseudoxanthomonas winnipegensis TaxID=2480810 RepID=UPI0010409A29|nr:ankyrin repeat domain-containing protein [Pseudoxanthomonas winnipegensis]TBV69746.1 hypothetical protein EYC45_19040 [Pseudoxanthomonas winnipegensis]